MGVSKTSDFIQINIKMPNLSQEPPPSSKPTNEYLTIMYISFTRKIKVESQNSDQGSTKDQWPYPNKDLDAKS